MIFNFRKSSTTCLGLSNAVLPRPTWNSRRLVIFQNVLKDVTRIWWWSLINRWSSLLFTILKMKRREAVQTKDEEERVWKQIHAKIKHLKEEYSFNICSIDEEKVAWNSTLRLIRLDVSNLNFRCNFVSDNSIDQIDI